MASTVVTVRTPGRRPIVVVLEERLELGRDCDGLIVPDTRMSRRHVALEPGPDGTVIVTDLGSSNGTTIDDEPVLYPSPVADGATVRAGNTEIVIGRQRVKRVGRRHRGRRDVARPRRSRSWPSRRCRTSDPRWSGSATSRGR